MSNFRTSTAGPLVLMGVDPSYNSTGYGVVQLNGTKMTCLTFGTIKEKLSWPERLHTLYERTLEIVNQYEPHEFAIEEVFVAKNVKTSLKLGHVRGAIMVAPLSKGIPVFEYSPLDIKKAVSGYGRAEKSQIKYMVKQILKLDKEPQSDDESDALALCICHANIRKMKILLENK